MPKTNKKTKAIGSWHSGGLKAFNRPKGLLGLANNLCQNRPYIALEA